MPAPVSSIAPVDYEVVNAIGTVVRTFTERDLARAFADERCADLGPLEVQAVKRSERRWTVYSTEQERRRA